MLRIAPNVADLLDHTLGDWTAVAVSRAGRYSGRIDAAVIGGAEEVLVLARWDEMDLTEAWWRVSRAEDGEVRIEEAAEPGTDADEGGARG